MKEQEQEDWWNKPAEPKKPKPTVDELIGKIEQMRRAQAGIPKGLVLMQGLALVFIIINIVFMYANISHPMALIIAVYMVPSTMLLFHYLLVIRQLKLVARGE